MLLPLSLSLLVTLLLPVPVAPATPAPAPDLVSESSQLTLRGDWDLAIERLEPAIQAAVARRDRVNEAILRAELGRVLADRNFFKQSDPARARQALDLALRVARAAHHAPSIANATMAIGQLHFSAARRTNDWKTPRGYFRRVIAMREKLGDQRGLAQAYFYLGLTYEQDSQSKASEPFYRKALAYGEAAGDPVQQSYAHRHIGGLHDERGEYDLALTHISRQVELRRTGGFAVGVPYALMQLADFVDQRQGRRDEAIKLLEEAIDLAEQAHSPRALSAAQSSLAKLQLANHNAPLAVSFLRCALDNARAYGDGADVREMEQALESAQSGGAADQRP
jgi:tetratricopeptide (TPR) repeat protein